MPTLNPDLVAVPSDGPEVVLLRSGLQVALPLAAALVVGSFLLRGTSGGVTALVSAAVLLGLHLATAKAAAAAGRMGPQALQAVTLFGFLGRLAMYGVLIALFHDVAGVDGPVLATVVVVLTVAMLVAEARVAARYSKFWWQTPPHTETTASPADAGVHGKDPA
jgi:hypothetical protein